MRKLFVLSLAVLSVSSIASAKPNCGNWVPQTNGTSWRMCIDAQGNRYCQMAKNNSVIVPMRCP
jgi:hypothetical protein